MYGASDLHNRYRQGFLALERVVSVRNWWTRVLMTIIGIIVTNAYLLWVFEGKAGADDTFAGFVEGLAEELVNNSAGDGLGARSGGAAAGVKRKADPIVPCAQERLRAVSAPPPAADRPRLAARK